MASREKFKLNKIAAQRRQTVDEILLPLINKYGSQKAAADELGVAPSTVAWWLRANGYVAQIKWVKESETA